MKVNTILLAVMFAAGCAGSPRPLSVPVDGGSIYVDDGGRGALPIVFIHGNGGSSEQWRAELEHFRATGHRAVAIDLPGFGRSTAPLSKDFSLDAAANAIERATDALRLNRFVIVGHSYGGAVAAKYAAAHPEKVAGVIYVDAAAMKLPLTDEQKNQLTAAFRADKMKVVHAWFAPILKPSAQAVSDEVFASVERTSTDAFIGAFMSLTAYDAKQVVDAYHGPRLAIVASDIESPASFQIVFPEIETVRIPGAGHWLMLDKPDEVGAAIDAFLDRAAPHPETR